MAKQKWVIYLITWWSGYFVMALELLGGRTLAPFFGTGIYVWGAIITLFMLSLSLGYLLGGHFSARQPTLRKLSILLLAATLAATPCASWATPILERVFDTLPDPRYGALASSLVLFFLPITISGAISPYAIRLLVDGQGTSGQVAGMVFFISTFGSTAGTLLTSFYLVLIFELDQLFYGMMVISILVTLTALLIGSVSRAAAPHAA
ncbi:MAG: fused MFS/spermidine synthase [Magnetococcales bacterium]|nr:fused MFS/spermidine synthase [Magnetococcales bacterium]